MSPQDTPGDTVNEERSGEVEGDEDNDSLASKLSKELTNWRRRRTTSRPKRSDGTGGVTSEPARTIKVRGHETLVIRKPKLAAKTPVDTESPDQ
jgi:hypothetical protein